MNIEKILEEIFEIRNTLNKHKQAYLDDSIFSEIIDTQLNSRLPLLKLFLKKSNLNEYYDLINEGSVPVFKNAIQVVDLLYSIKDDILECAKWSNPNDRLKLINKISYTMQSNYNLNEIDIILSSVGIKCGKEYYVTNSKRVYVQNILQNEPIIKIIKLAKSQNLFFELQDIREATKKLASPYIDEQIEKCINKINNFDYSGAITNARTLLEEVLLLIIQNITGTRPDNDGDLQKLYKTVRKLLNLEPNDPKINNSLIQITSGLNNIVYGMSCVSNNAGDRHACIYKPDKRNALLVVNSTLILCKFLIESYELQFILK